MQPLDEKSQLHPWISEAPEELCCHSSEIES